MASEQVRRAKRVDSGLRLMELVAVCQKLDNAQDIVACFGAFVAEVGFTSLICLRWPAASLPTGDNILATTRSKSWLAEYQSRGLARSDPILREASMSLHPFAWSEVGDSRKVDAQGRRVLKLAASYGMKDGFAVPIGGLGMHMGLVSLAGERCDLTPATRASLTLASLYFYNLLAALRRQRVRTPAHISARELEILHWIAAGKSDWDAGQILGISAKTVNYHVERVKRKLGVATRTQAVVAALGEQVEKK